MNPYKAVAGQAGCLVGCLILALLFGGRATFWVLLVAMALLTTNNLVWFSVYLVGRVRRKRPGAVSRWRQPGDVLAVIEALVPAAAFVVCALSMGTSGPLSGMFGAITISTVTTALSLMLAAITGSSMVDWFYIRPLRDGVVREPPCMTADDPRWASLTKAWLIHRLVAELAFVLFFALTGLGLVLEGVEADGAGGWVRTAVSAVITVTGIVLGYSSARIRIALVGIPGANERARFALGETLAWKVNSNAVVRLRSERRFGVGKLRWQLRRVEVQGRKRPRLHASGRHGYVRGVSLSVADILEMNGKQDGSANKVLEVPMDVLFHPSARIERSQISWCASQRRCLLLEKHCEMAGRHLM